MIEDALSHRLDSILPEGRIPRIVICGGTGTGKTSTLNALLGRSAGVIGHYARGTESDQLHEWTIGHRQVNLVDLPGLGDSSEREHTYREMYWRRAVGAHGYIVVVSPPRPAGIPTVRAVMLLLRTGVAPDRIVFAYNRVTMMNVESGGVLHPIDIRGTAGPAGPEERRAILEARRAFARDIGVATHGNTFSEDQVMPYDALTGWNLATVIDKVLDTIR